MGKKKPSKSEYNDFLDGEKLTDNTEIRTTLQGFAGRPISPPPSTQYRPGGNKKKAGGPKKSGLTHFLCLPLVTETSRPQIQQGLEKFKEDLAKDGLVPTKAVRPVGTLHLTLGVMSLNPGQLQEAILYLLELDLHNLLRDITYLCVAEKAAEEGTVSENLNAAAMPDTDALMVNLETLLPMQSPIKTSILYAEPKDGSQRLQPFAQALREQFTEKEFLVKDDRPLRLHATILNTIYAKPKRGGKGRPKKQDEVKSKEQESASPQQEEDDNASIGSTAESNPPAAEKREGHGPDARSWMKFDARTLIEQYKDFIWAEGVRVDRVCICKMGAKKLLDRVGEVVDEAYEVVAEKGIFE
jgi:activating signal cointegrator complex subunit 1